ncbi:SDR family oxidoreductase [Rhodococcoides kyotonense]|uniref:2,3-dihydro-2,3-dihydroxybenzoate dehydrogenase n=1 Tax=Rhodococcoides kyotonense TaxID=398843 RepID=A0A177YGA3_9NOCA|nr:SDR family oxidoreductase [Rhodococcus kyotonensis]OAK54574.1 2,3-dihydro-2,3-dihydroxybenzoate dehydrogenase [Rhodococcus kyotonensis]
MTTLVVGAGRGIGRAVALTLARAGHRLALMDSDATALAETTDCLDEATPAYTVDIRDADAVGDAIDDAEARIGPLTGLAHVAGILETGSILDSDPGAWQKTYDVNVFGLLNVVRHTGRSMRERRSGSIVVVGSNAAGVPRMSMGAYGSSKAAATMLVRILGLEVAQYGIRANIVAPGSTDTDMQRSMWPDPEDDAHARPVIEGDLATFKAGIPLGRIALPEDIADSVEFLLSDRARHITMQSLYVDGGATLRA